MIKVMLDFFDLNKGNKKVILNLIILGFFVLALPVAIYLVRQQQIIKSRAAVDPITFSGENVTIKNSQYIALGKQITVEITSPLGPPSVEFGIGQTDAVQPNKGFGIVKTAAAAACTLDAKKLTPDLGATCSSCIYSNKPKIQEEIDYIKGFGHTSCSNQQIITYMCNGGISPENQSGCQAVKNGVCASSCGVTGGSKDSSGPATACNGNISYSSKPDLYALWNGKCDGKKQLAGSGIGQTCCEQACGASAGCDEQYAGQGSCDANCQPTANTVPSTKPGSSTQPISTPRPVTSTQPAVSTRPATSTQPVSSTQPTVFTTHYRIAENNQDLKQAAWETYKQPLSRTWEFKDQNPGDKTIYVEFKATNGKEGGCGTNNSQPCSKKIRLAGSGPVITGCALSSEGNSTVFNITGSNFGPSRGSLQSGGDSLQIRDWKDKTITGVSSNIASDQQAPVTLTNADGQATEGQCSVSSVLSLGAKLLCSTPSSMDLNSADLTIAGIFEGGKVSKQKVKVSKEGTIAGMTEKLQAGKKYRISLKTPHSLRKTSGVFTAETGATNIPDFILPVGDIFPIITIDGTINALDKGELNRQWTVAGNAVGRTGDLNGDGRINSIDWACMRYGYGRTDEDEPKAGPIATPVASPGPTQDPSQSPQSSPLPSAQGSQSPTPTISPAPGSSTPPSSSPTPGPTQQPGRHTPTPQPSTGGWTPPW